MVGYGVQQCHQESGIRSFCSAILKVLSIWPLPALSQLQKYMHPKVGEKEWELLTHLRGRKRVQETSSILSLKLHWPEFSYMRVSQPPREAKKASIWHVQLQFVMD